MLLDADPDSSSGRVFRCISCGREVAERSEQEEIAELVKRLRPAMRRAQRRRSVVRVWVQSELGL